MKKDFFQNVCGTKVFTLMLAALACMAVTACGSDDDEDGDSSLETPKYETESAKYTITDESCDYESIELTESGNYIIVCRTATSFANAKQVGKVDRKPVKLFGNAKKAVTRGSDSGILYGTYTKTDNGEYDLDGIGILKIIESDGTACTLQLTHTNGTVENIQGSRKSVASDSDFTKKVCRTWKIEKIRLYYIENGKTIYNISGSSFSELGENMKAWAKANDDEYDEIDWEYIDWAEDGEPYQLVITRSGTYMVYYRDSSIAVARWRWLSEADGQFQYDWGYDWTDDDSGEAWFKLSSGKLLITEKEAESEDGDTYESGLEYTLTEVK